MDHRNRARPTVLTVIVLLLSVLLTSCGGEAVGPTTPGVTPTTGAKTPATANTPAAGQTPTPQAPREVKVSVLVKNLEAPWGLAFFPDGRALVSERDSGKVFSVDAAGNVQEVQQLPSGGGGEGGLLGVALSPNYATDGLVYAYYTTNTDNRVVRFRLGDAPQIILQGIPAAGIHNGGRIAFGSDGKLYIGTGDAAQRGTSQDRESLGGKILRINADGTFPNDNPFPNSPVYSYGHRNVQGLAWDKNGQLYAAEFGQNQFDEINKIVPGGNYGWPEVEGIGNNTQFINPITTFTTGEASPSGIAILNNGAIPQWEGNIFMACLRGNVLWRVVIDADGKVTNREELLKGEFGRLRHVEQAPDGSLWILTSNRDGRGSPTGDDDRILRLAAE